MLPLGRSSCSRRNCTRLTAALFLIGTLADDRVKKLRLDVFLESMLRVGAKSYYHTARSVEKLHDAFMGLVDSPEARGHVIEFVATHWARNPQVTRTSDFACVSRCCVGRRCTLLRSLFRPCA